VPPTSNETPGRKPIQRWSAARKRDAVLRLLRGELIDAVSGQLLSNLSDWSSASEPLPRRTRKDRAEDDPTQVGPRAPREITESPSA
jgi:hypothetical protein